MKFNVGDMVRIVNDEVKGAKFGVIVGANSDLINVPYCVFMYDSKGNYIGARCFGEDELDESNMCITYSYKLVTNEDGSKFHVNDKVKMVDGLDDEYSNANALNCEFGIVRQVDDDEGDLKYYVEFYGPWYEFWCEEKQLELIE